MTAKQKIIASLESASDDLSAEEAIHRIVLLSNLDAAAADADEIDQEAFVKELAAEGAFDEGSVEEGGPPRSP